MTVVWSARALSDVAGIFAYLAEGNETAAAHVVDRLMAAGENVARFPHLGRPSRVARRREMVVDSYVITYRVRRDSVQIVSVEHGARRR